MVSGGRAVSARAQVLFLQRHAGNAAVGRLLSGPGGRRLLQRDYYDEGLPGARYGMDVGDTGPGVKLLQRLLGAKQTGVFDAETRAAVDHFQHDQMGWKPGGVGAETWKAVEGHAGSPGNRPNLVQGDRGPGVALMQKALGVQQTGYFGRETRKAVDAFQKLQGWKPSGVGPDTWKALEHELNRLSVADQMQTMADPAAPTRAVWHGSSNKKDWTDFSAWALAAAEDPAFTVSNTTVINCWEMVLYSAWKMKVIDWAWIHAVYSWPGPGSWADELAKRLIRGGAKTWDRKTKSPRPRRGDIVMFDGVSHVALATGVTDAAGTHVYSFWPPPNTPFNPLADYKHGAAGKGLAGGTPDDVKDTTIEALVAVCDTIATGGKCVVTLGPPAW